MRRLLWIMSLGLGALWALRRVLGPPTHEHEPGGVFEADRARTYARFRGLPPMSFLTRWLARRAIALADQGKVLDIGCGGGHLLMEMAALSPKLELTGIDLSDELLTFAHEEAQRKGLSERTRFQKGDAQSIPFPNGEFDLVVSTLALHHFEDVSKVLDEVARVLKPEGRFLLFDFRRDAFLPARLLIGLLTWPVRRSGPLATHRNALTPEELRELAYRSSLPPWRIAYGPFWMSLENATSPE